ncbi:hypothetical protein MFLO_15623, partial [Listeria floridensis FSL S10-1187]
MALLAVNVLATPIMTYIAPQQGAEAADYAYVTVNSNNTLGAGQTSISGTTSANGRVSFVVIHSNA